MVTGILGGGHTKDIPHDFIQKPSQHRYQPFPMSGPLDTTGSITWCFFGGKLFRIPFPNAKKTCFPFRKAIYVKKKAMQEKKEMFFVFSRNFAIITENICRFFCYTLPETNIFAPENGWLEYDRFLLGPGLFSGALTVGFREGTPCCFFKFEKSGTRCRSTAFAVGPSGTGRV